MVPSAFAYHTTINGSLLTPAMTKCDHSSTLSSTLGQSQMQPLRLLAFFIYREPIVGSESYTRLRLVPSEFYNILFVAFHSKSMGGQFNVYHTLHRLWLRFYWPGMYKFI